MTRPTRMLDYAWTSIPKSARVARRSGRMSAAEYDVLAEITDRANHDRLRAGQETPTMTLAQLAEAVGWEKTESALHKLLCRLRDAGWLSWRIEKRSHYVFHLHRPDDRSESVPTSDGLPVPSSDGPQPALQTGIAGANGCDRSEFGGSDPW